MEHTRYNTKRWAPSGAIRSMVAASALLFAACSTSTDVGKPSSARILIEGTTPEALELIVATDFVRVIDPIDFTEEHVLLESDTLLIEPVYDSTIDIEELGSVFYRLSHFGAETAQVQMRVWLDGGLEYNQSATLAMGGALQYSFVFNELVF